MLIILSLCIGINHLKHKPLLKINFESVLNGVNQMQAFSKLSLLEQARYTRLEWLSNQALRLHLKAQRYSTEASLQAKMLMHLTALPEFKTLDEQSLSVLITPFVRNHATLLNQLQTSILDRQPLLTEISELRQTMDLS